MISTKDLIDELSTYPDDAEWKPIFNKAILSDEGIIDFNSIIIKNETANAKALCPIQDLTKIVIEGKEKMLAAVERVIAKHEWKIARRVKVESEYSLIRKKLRANLNEFHCRAMGSLPYNSQEQYLDSLVSYYKPENLIGKLYYE
jgi:hypothetical protein